MAKRQTEQRARYVAREILKIRYWNTDLVGNGGQCLEENEYKNHKHLNKIFKGKSKSKKGTGDGYPDFLLVDSFEGLKPILIVETKPDSKQIGLAISDAIHYGEACKEHSHNVLCVGVAGGEKEICAVSVKRLIGKDWVNLTLNGIPVDWIPSPEQTERILQNPSLIEVKPEIPSGKVLASNANRLNEIFRECKIKDELRPTYIATFMLALWQGEVSVNHKVVLNQINSNSESALAAAGKSVLSKSLRVDNQNTILAEMSWEIVEILQTLNIRSFIQEHDYLGQLYETFFRYTGKNTIGQYFTPRHIIDFMCEILDISPSDTILDPACGTGGFLVGALRKMVAKENLPYEDAVKLIGNNLFGIESEPATAALCITNMILRGDGKSGVVKDNCFKLVNYPEQDVDFVLMNPPFPHNKKTDTPTIKFLDRALKSITNRGFLASIVPYSLLVRMDDWHKKILKSNTLFFVATLPPDLFEPYSSYNTAILIIQKGVPHENKKVFMARIVNDGFKVKKKYRIEKDGSQLQDVLSAFQKKSSIPEFTAYPSINIKSEEWAPENYIENKIHSDADFIYEFEEFIRKHASFYIAMGNRVINNSIEDRGVLIVEKTLFESKSSISFSGITFGNMNVSKYFDVVLGGKDEIEDLDDGNMPVVSTSEFMNGITTWRKPNRVYPFPSITVATDGSICSSFVQEFSYYAFYKVAILTPKKDVIIPVNALYYIAFLLSKEKWRYVFARKFGKKRIDKTSVIVPVLENGEPDFEKMGEITRISNGFPVIHYFRSNS